VFVPGFPPLAFSTPDLVTLQDRLLEPSDKKPLRYIACVVAHELAHAWFGGLVDMRHDRDMWLQEALATYIGRSALEETETGSTPMGPGHVLVLPDYARFSTRNESPSPTGSTVRPSRTRADGQECRAVRPALYEEEIRAELLRSMLENGLAFTGLRT
jgi:hypothetical protein